MTTVRRGRQYPDGPLEAPPGRPEGAGEFMFSLFGGGTGPEPGPPYVHTLIPPQPCPTGCDDDCELNPDGCHERHQPRWKRDHDPDECEASRRPGPSFTLTEDALGSSPAGS